MLVPVKFRRSTPSNLPPLLPLRTIVQLRETPFDLQKQAVDGLNFPTFLYFLNRIQQIWPKSDAGLEEADISYDGPSLLVPQAGLLEVYHNQ